MTKSSQKLAKFSVPAGRIAAVAMAGSLLAGCQDTGTNTKAYRPIPAETLALMESKGATKNSPVLIRAYKKEAELEVWKMKSSGEYALVKTFPMCRWSGQLGPKMREGDRQVPEGFYAITPGQMNPNSAYYLSFNVGYPNALDRAQGYTGGNIMVHGACSSAGCFSMTDAQIEEIYAIAREAFAGGQRAIQMQSYPFRMTPENLAKHRLDPNMAFWRQLKEGSDRFDVTKREPQVNYCGRRYVFDAKASGQMDALSACPPLQQDAQVATLVSEKARADDAKVAELVSKGVQPIKVVYSDGGQHPSMAHVMEVSRPEAIAAAPREIFLDGKGRPVPAVVQVAAAKAVETPVKIAAPPAPAKAAPVKAASAPAPTPVTVAEDASEPSTISRLLSFSPKLPSLFGSSESVKATETASPAPMPPPRPRASAQPVKPQASAKPQPSAKPQASLLAPQPVRVAMNAPAHRVNGAAPILGSELAR
jgi:murein L,D-transpeptidase YafK